MRRSLLAGARCWFLIAGVLVAHDAMATPLVDPITRVRDGGASIPITSLPFVFAFGEFPSDPDGAGTDCQVNPYIDPAGTVVSCAFQNQTGVAISFLNVSYDVPGDPTLLAFFADDPDDLFASENASTVAANFAGNGIAPARCDIKDDVRFCFGGEFLVDVIGFPDGTQIRMRADVTAVPEPATMLLVASGLVAAGWRRRKF